MVPTCMISASWHPHPQHVWPFQRHGSHCSHSASKNYRRSSIVLMHPCAAGSVLSLDYTATTLPITCSSSSHSILCLSNGHGEDSIAASILSHLSALGEERGVEMRIEALPLVGEGHAYRRQGIVTLGPAKTMPSGGFIYMDVLQLIGDVRAGLLALTLQQWEAVTHWVDRNPDGVLLAVGDVVPLAFAWLASQRLKKSKASRGSFAFVGTAKSEFYVRGSDGTRLTSTSWLQNLEFLLSAGSVYYPWERAMMSDSQCRLVVPRDDLTAHYLQKHLPHSQSTKVQSLGNPMMDDLKPTGGLSFLANYEPAKFVAVLPGSRAPEIYRNWKQLLLVAEEVSISQDKLAFLVPIVPALEPSLFMDALVDARWQPHALQLHVEKMGELKSSAWAYDVRNLQVERLENWPANNGVALVAFEKGNAVIILIRGNFNDVAHWADAGIAMAGTATEQLVGQGKPVFTIPGEGPQFTAAFADAQSRLLGESVVLESNTKELARRMKDVLSNADELLRIANNGRMRMGAPGASSSISHQFWKRMLQ
ncbi:hypothetical protein M758_1G116400 [Ceratodon purpureus]|nr:hypothetical protein M758_1G116400 [Ceratodon purpureus]